MEIINLVSQQSNAFEKPTIAELEIMLHATSNMHEPSVVQGSDVADNHLVKMIGGKLIAEQLRHSSDRPFGNSRQTTNGIGMGNSWVLSTNLHVVKTAEELQMDYPVRRDETFRHGYIPYNKDESRLAWSCAIDSRISLAYAAGEDDPTPLVADIIPAHKRIGYDEQMAVIMDDDNRDTAICIVTHMFNTCRAIIIQGDDGKKILPSVFKSMGLVGVVLLDKMIQHLVPDYLCHRAEYSMEGNFPMYLTLNKKTGKTCFILTCPQIGSSLVRPDIGLEGKLWTQFIYLSVSNFLKITGAKYCQEFFPDFTTVKESVLSILNTKKGTSDHMELLHKSGQLSNVVIFKAPRQIGGENSHATDPGKQDGSHFIEKKNRDSMPTVDRCRMAGKANLGKPKSGFTDFFVTEEVNLVDKTPLSEKGSRFANTKRKTAAQLVHEGAVPSFKSCTTYMSSWIKEANDTESKTIFIEGKKMQRKDCGSLPSLLKSMETLPQ